MTSLWKTLKQEMQTRPRGTRCDRKDSDWARAPLAKGIQSLVRQTGNKIAEPTLSSLRSTGCSWETENCIRSLLITGCLFITPTKSLCCLHTDPGFCYKEIYELGEHEVIIKTRLWWPEWKKSRLAVGVLTPTHFNTQDTDSTGLTPSIPTYTRNGTVY